jgi:hypothetical protein
MSASDNGNPGGQPSITQPMAGTVRLAKGGNRKQFAKCIAGHGRESLEKGGKFLILPASRHRRPVPVAFSMHRASPGKNDSFDTSVMKLAHCHTAAAL